MNFFPRKKQIQRAKQVLVVSVLIGLLTQVSGLGALLQIQSVHAATPEVVADQVAAIDEQSQVVAIPEPETASELVVPAETVLPAPADTQSQPVVPAADTEALNNGTLKVIKHVVGGHNQADDWMIHVIKENGQDAPNSPQLGSETGTSYTLPGNHEYTVNETDGPTQYALTYSASCPNGVITVPIGQTVTCTLTNTRHTGTLVVHKLLDENGDGIIDEVDPEGWTYNIHNVENNIPMGQERLLETDTYAVSENQHEGYTATAWKCYRDTELLGSGTGETLNVNVTRKGAECWFTNTRNLVRINFDKILLGGGPAVEHDFTFTINGIAGEFHDGESVLLPANSWYSVQESSTDAFDQLYALTDASGACELDKGGIMLYTGTMDATCSVTNTRNTGTVIVHKNVLGPDGMTDVADPAMFAAQLDGANTQSLSESTAVTYSNVPTGNHIISEVATPDYDMLSITNGGNITVVTGQTTHVYIVNAQKPAHIIVYKDVLAYNGTDVQDATLFNVTVDGTTSPFGEGAPAHFSVWPGTYTATELAKAGYVLDQYLPSQMVTVGSNGKATITVTNKQDTHLITVVKSDAPDPVQAGAQLTYTIDWTVGGNAPVTNLTLTDLLPPQVTFVSATNGGMYTDATRTVAWNLGNQAPGASGQFAILVTVASPLANGTVIVNTVTLDSTETDPATDTETTTVISAPVLTITKTVNLSFANPGDTATYTVTIANTGNGTAVNVSLTDTLPAGLTFVDGGTNTKTFLLGNILPGGNIVTTYNVKVAPTVAAGFYDNVAVAKADNHSAIQATARLEVRIPVVASGETGPELTLTKRASVDTANAGDIVTYHIVITNTGSGSAEDVRLIDTLPSGFTYTDTGSAKRVWVIGSLLPDESREITYDTKISKDIKAGSYTNTVKATSSNHHTLEANDVVDVHVPVVKGALVETGAGPTEYALFAIGLLAIIMGYDGLRRSRYLPIRP